MNAVVELKAERLTAKQEAFARFYVEYQNASSAYRAAYDISWATQPNTVWNDASRVLAHPGVAARVQELQQAAAASTIIRARDVLHAQLDIANADVNDLVRISPRCCRHCWGVGHAKQWQELEWTFAAADAVDAGVTPPTAHGGFDFDPQREPNPACPECYGAGVRIVFVSDSAKLTSKARRLYKGVKVGSNGQLEILMANPEDARKEVSKLLGAYQTDGKIGELGLPPPADVPQDANADPAQGYMEMITRKPT